jgi:hypothetical protein
MAYLNTLTLQYPLTERDIREAHPNVSFNEVFTPPDDYAWVFPTPQPNYDQMSQFVILGAPNLTHLGHYEETWTIQPRFQTYTDQEGTVHTAVEQLAQVVAANLAARKAQLVNKVDDDVDAILKRCVGERTSEYQRAENQARAYKAGGYIGNASKLVHDWAVIKGQTDAWAANNIIAQADTWIGAQDVIREHRLRAKESYRSATTEEQLNTTLATWGTFSNYIRGQLGI